MVTREEYNNIVRKYFRFLVDKYNYFELDDKKHNSMLYDVEYTNICRIISVSFEIMEESINVIIFKIVDGKKSGYDDYENTIHLNRVIECISDKDLSDYLNKDMGLFKHLEKANSPLEKDVLRKAKLLSYFMRKGGQDK